MLGLKQRALPVADEKVLRQIEAIAPRDERLVLAALLSERIRRRSRYDAEEDLVYRKTTDAHRVVLASVWEEILSDDRKMRMGRLGMIRFGVDSW